MVKTNDQVEDFTILITGDRKKQLSDYQGQYLVLYFYPKASTPGCTTESIEFTEHYAEFQKAGVEILGVSMDSLKRQENFKAKHDFSFDLIADTEEELCNYFDVIKEKKMYGKTFMGIERSTFLLDQQGRLVHEWRKVKVKGHVEEVLTHVQNL
ncbi:peroxiredoxin [Marinicella sp. W31]|uniref:peroxiredoxin n=1 Tax=Marinicella sp. W31 TaxID=3023713 RepID=UPI0037569D98